MAISASKYVQIFSAVTGAAALPAREFTGLRFSSSRLTPSGSALQFLNATDVADYYGTGTPEARFAAQYFAMTLPSPAAKASNILFTGYSPAGKVPAVVGTREHDDLEELKTITAGSITVDFDGAQTFSGIDFSAATSMANVASILQTKLRTGTGQLAAATVEFDAVGDRFIISGGDAQESSASLPSGSVAVALGVASGVSIEGRGAQEPEDAFDDAMQLDRGFGTFSFADDVTPAQAREVALKVVGGNYEYIYLQPVTSANYSDFYDALNTMAGTGLVLNKTPNEFKEAALQAARAAIDYDLPNAAVNFMYLQANYTPDVTTNLESQNLDAKRINYYGITQLYANRVAFLQRGYLMGNQGVDAIDMGVYASEQWLKSEIARRMLNLLIAVRLLSADTIGQSQVAAEINDVAQRAVSNRVIAIGSPLSSLQVSEIISIAGSPRAPQVVQTNGYWFDVKSVRENDGNGIEQWVIKYTLIYRANEGVRKIEGSHNLVV